MDTQNATPCVDDAQVLHRPWFKFQRAEWLGSVKLRACSLEARGLWADILAASDPDGYVRVTVKAIAAVAGVAIEHATALIAELERNGVLHRGTDDMILVRTIARDRAQTCYGRKGGLASAEKRGGSKAPFEGTLGREGSNRRAILPLNSGSLSDSSLRVESLSPSEGSSLSSQRATQGSSSPVCAGARASKPPKPKAEPPKPAGGNPATRAWDEEFEKQVGAPFVWIKSQARGQAVALAECLQAAGSLEEFRRRVRCLLKSDRKWHVEHRTPRGLLQCWNDFPAPKAVAAAAPTVQDARVDDVVGRTLDSMLGGLS